MTQPDWIAPDRLFDGTSVLTGAALRIAGGRIAEIAGNAPRGAHRIAGLVAPGFVDLQVNGGGGVMLNDTPDRDTMQAMAAAHRRFGTVAILPTLISDAADKMAALVPAMIAAQQDAGLIGVHLEGPHIAPVKRGTHAERHIRPFDAQTLDAVAALRAAGVRVMITLAPEATPPEMITRLADLGAVVSLGHSDCTASTARAAMAAGASCATHLFNAMSQMVHRAPGLVGAIINSDSFAGIICDGHHVADEMVGLAIRARPRADRMFLVSDAMATVGGPDHFDLYGDTVRLRDGKLINGEGSLAGAHITQLDGMRRLVQRVGIDLAQALAMVTAIPAACIGAPEYGGVAGRRLSDLVVLNDDLGLVGMLDQALELAEPLDAPL